MTLKLDQTSSWVKVCTCRGEPSADGRRLIFKTMIFRIPAPDNVWTFVCVLKDPKINKKRRGWPIFKGNPCLLHFEVASRLLQQVQLISDIEQRPIRVSRRRKKLPKIIQHIAVRKVLGQTFKNFFAIFDDRPAT